MATKKFNQMSTKKLNALLETANDEDKAAIEAILEARAQHPVIAIVDNNEPTEEPAEEPKTTKAPKATTKKMSDEERQALAESLKKNIGHKCQVVPFNTIEWVDGYIAGVVEEKRVNKVLYAIKIEDGRRIVKVHDSNMLRVLDEVVTLEKRARKAKSAIDRIEWTPELLTEEINKYIGNVGKVIEFSMHGTMAPATGRIIGIVPDKRVQVLLYRIALADSKIVHKVVTAEGLNIPAEFDEEGAQFNEKYCARREAAANRTPITPQDRVMKCKENVAKIEEKLAKLQKELAAKMQQLAEAEAELEAYLAAQSEQNDLA